MKFIMMTNFELQKKCHESASAYMDNFWPGLREHDIEKHANLLNAFAAGFAVGWQDAQRGQDMSKEELNKDFKNGK